MTLCDAYMYLPSIAVSNNDMTVSEDDILHCDRLLDDHYRSGAAGGGKGRGRGGKEGGREGGIMPNHA